MLFPNGTKLSYVKIETLGVDEGEQGVNLIVELYDCAVCRLFAPS